MKNFTKIFILTIFTLFVTLTSTIFAPTVSLNAQATESCTITSVKASHILVETKAQAEFIKSKIDNGESFEALAAKYSKCPSGKNGGDLGYFERGQMVPEFEDAAFELPVGKVSNPIKTEFGWHLIKVCDKK